MNDYEVLLMLDPETPEERHNEIIARTRETIEKGGGNWLSHDSWGRRRLAYEIDHKTDGVYHLLQFDAPSGALDEVSRVLKITEGVMRHMATRRPKGGGRVAPPPPLPAPEPVRERAAEPERERAPEPIAAPGVEDETPQAEAETADSESAVEEYAESTESEAPEAAPEEE